MPAPSAAAVTRRHHVTQLGRSGATPVVFAHGFGSDQDMWRDVALRFTEDHRVVLYDQVGAGRSDREAYDPRRYATVDGYAEDLLEICEALDLREAVVVGHSISAMVAVAAAARDASRIAQLVLVAPSPRYVDDPETGYVGGFSTEDVEELLESLDSNYFAWAETMAPVVMGNPDAPHLGEALEAGFCRLDPDVARDVARLTFLSDSRDLLPRVPVHAVVLQCRQDALAPPEVGAHVHRALPHSTLVHLRATGHCPHVSAPAETAAAIRAHLRVRS
ncbi:alpha/beta fold hydrolase [uncultured Pseudokineococcus sp.]|uniref:alpha/beta fold hydrolase n=1 Tax=uncultured Pseudokineococcus sp. TaxID=1642928 RepID=UPI002619BEF8|nr:alpha/beta hydrolase [uncultured Pseudokineococcus sp.]